jgi:CarboxypepD_reg-like domain/Secretion system C-terminal sorting domain
LQHPFIEQFCRSLFFLQVLVQFHRLLLTVKNCIGMNKKITLSIPEPCHENWDSMTASQQGRFCGSCQKNVIDFTAMSDDELFTFFTQKSQGSICGRLHANQLDTPVMQPVVHKKKRFWYLQYAAAFLLLLTRPGGAKAQTKPPVTTSPPKPIRVTMGIMLPVVQAKWLKGTVVNEAKEPVTGASVTIKGSSHGVSTDVNGHYQLRIRQKDIVLLSAIGYESKEVVITEENLSITTVLKSKRTILAGEIVVSNDKQPAKLSNNTSSLTDVLAGKLVGRDFVLHTTNEPQPQLRPNPISFPTSSDVMLRGRIGGVVIKTKPVASSSCKQSLSKLFTQPIKRLFTTASSKADNMEQSLSVYPNPVSPGGRITLTTKAFPAGNYTISIMTIAGAKIFSIPAKLTKNSPSIAINTAHVKNPGIYVIEMTSESGKSTVCKLLVQ